MLLFLNILQTLMLIAIAAGVYVLISRPPARPAAGTRRSLHSRRCEIYNDVVRILTLLGKRGEVRKEELLEFRSRTQDAALLFDGEIGQYIDEIYSRGVKLMSTSEILQGTSMPVGEERDSVTVENAKHLIWLADQLPLVPKRFAQYQDVLTSCGAC